MPFGPYNLRTPGVNKSLGKAQARFARLCGDVVIKKAGDPEKLKEYRSKQKEFRKKYEL